MRNMLFAILVLVLAACGGEMPTAAAPANTNITSPEFAWEEESPVGGLDETRTPVSKNVSAPFDIGGVMRQVHFAFREKDGFFEGGDTNYAVKVSKDGSFSVTPYHYPNGKRDMARAESHDLREEMERTEHREREKPMAGKAASFRTLGLSGPRITTNDKTALEINRGEIVEELKNTEKGVEQSWRFAKKPTTTGDLDITVVVDGLDYIGTTDQGLHFAEKGSSLGLRYGVATWIDARGEKTIIVPQWRNSMITLTVPLDVIGRTTYPAILDPIIGPEFGMDEPVYVFPERDQSDPAVVFDGENYFVVWQDPRRNGGDSDIYGARISKEGIVLDSSGIMINDTLEKKKKTPAIAFDGENYFVVWSSFSSNYGPADIYGARVSKGGAVLDPKGIAINTAPGDKVFSALAFDGDNYLVVWQGSHIYGTRVSKEGTVLDPNGIVISAAGLSPSIAFDGINYLVAWASQGTGGIYYIYGARISKEGTVLDPSGIAISTAANERYSPAIAFDGTNYLVVWYDFKNGIADIYGARVTQDGTVLDTDGIAISTATDAQVYPAIAFDGTNYLVIWDDYRNGSDAHIYGTRVSKEGTVFSPNGTAISTVVTTVKNDPAIAFDGTNYFIVWRGHKNGSYDNIYGARIAQDETVLDADEIIISLTANNQNTPTIAFDGTNYLVAWADRRNDSSDIYGSRVSTTGTILDTSGIVISRATGLKYRPAIAFNGTDYLVVWEDYRRGSSCDIYGARVSKTGVVLDSNGIAISTAPNDQLNPSVAFGGINYLVVWQDNRKDDAILKYDIYGAQVKPTGVVMSNIAINTTTDSQSSPAIAFDGTKYLVVWADYRNGTDADIYGTRVSKEGAVDPSRSFAICTATGSQSSPAIAFDGTNYLVVWRDYRTGVFTDIYGARVSTYADGANPNGGLPISATTRHHSFPDIAFDGTNYLVVWEEYRGNAVYDIYGTRVASSGLPIGPEMTISEDGYFNGSPAIASSGNNRAMIVYYHFDDRYGFNSTRTAGRFYFNGEAGNSCENNDQCELGNCVDGACCVVPNCDDNNSCTIDSCAISGNGTCTHIAGNPGAECRPVAGNCDIAEFCSGDSIECPEDIFVTEGTVCRTTLNICDVTESCTGTSAFCPVEDYTAVNGNTCDDGSYLTENDVCAEGVCAGDLILGVCGNTIAVDPLPYTATGTTVGRPNALNAYGPACGDAGKPSPDIVYALTVEAGVEYLIQVTPEASYDVTINLIGTCQNSERCLGLSNGGGKGGVEAIVYSNGTPRTIYIALEGSAKNEVGSYEISVTTVEEPDDTPPTDADTVDDTVIEPDDEYVASEADSFELTDDAIADDILPDEDTWIHEPPPWGADDIVYPDDDFATTNDDTSVDTDNVVPDSTDTVITDADTFQPDETTDETADESSDETADSVIDDTDTVKPNGNSGCGCSTVF